MMGKKKNRDYIITFGESMLILIKTKKITHMENWLEY